MDNRKDNENVLITPPVDPQNAKIRVDKWLAACTDLSRSRVSALIDQGAVFLNGVCLRDQDKKTAAGEVYRIEIPAPVDAVPQAQPIPLDIVYEDADLLVVNKPAGMVVHPAAGNYDGTLVNALLSHCRESLSGIGGVIRPGIVHRLDKETSGLMVIAKNDEAHKGLSAQFAVHSLERCYLALIWGRLFPAQGVIETQIGRSSVNRKKNGRCQIRRQKSGDALPDNQPLCRRRGQFGGMFAENGTDTSGSCAYDGFGPPVGRR